MPGLAKQPRHLKLLKGNLRKSDAVPQPQEVFPPLTKLPRPPVWLRKDAHAIKEWRRVGPTLIRCKVLHEGNLSAFTMMCALYGRNVAAFVGGETPTAAHIATFRTLCGSLGLLAMNLSPPSSTNPNPFSAHQSSRP